MLNSMPMEDAKPPNSCMPLAMADFKEYPPNMSSHDTLVLQRQAESDHAVSVYAADPFPKSSFEPKNPFRAQSTLAKRKSVPTGHAQETFINDHIFRKRHRAMDRIIGSEELLNSDPTTRAATRMSKHAREDEGDATIVEGPGSYLGPWARYHNQVLEAGDETEDLTSNEEFKLGESTVDAIESGTLVQAPAAAIARRKEAKTLSNETTAFLGAAGHDYQGRTYMHVPQDLDVDLRKEVGSITNYIPKKQIYTWRDHSKPVTALRFFPLSGHVLLSADADAIIKIRDVYHERELLRSYAGHSKAISDVCFNHDGTQFLSASYDRMMKLWDTETGVCISRFTTGKTPHVVCFNPDPEHYGEFLAGMSDKKIIQFDIRTPTEVVQEYDHHLAAINTITFVDRNRRFMTTSDDRSLRAWDYNIPVPIKYIAEPDMYPMTNATIHPSGKYVAYQSSDNQILVYSANNKFRQNRRKSYRGHNNAALAIDLDCSPDGQFLASGDSVGYICFWDWKTCKMYHKLRAGNQAVTCVKWHPQETSKVATAGLDGEIRYWD